MALSTALAIAGLVGSGLVSGISAYKSAQQNKSARAEEKQAYEKTRLALNSDLYRSPLDSASNKALLKNMDERIKDMNDAADNMAAASGATAENRLAARQNTNQALSNTYTNLLLGEDARQQAIRNQQLALDNQHSQNVANNYMANAQNWQQWGAATSQALNSFATASALGAFGSDAALLHDRATGTRAVSNLMGEVPSINPANTLTTQAGVLTPSGLLPRNI